MATVFVVDDDPNYRGLLRSLLEDKGHLVAEAADGADALRYLDQLTKPPGLFIVDLRMPEMSGLELASRLRQHEKGRGIPVLMFTGCGEGVRDLAEREGVVFLQKMAATNEDILDHVGRLLQRAGGPGPGAPAKPLEIDRKFEI